MAKDRNPPLDGQDQIIALRITHFQRSTCRSGCGEDLHGRDSEIETVLRSIELPDAGFIFFKIRPLRRGQTCCGFFPPFGDLNDERLKNLNPEDGNLAIIHQLWGSSAVGAGP